MPRDMLIFPDLVFLSCLTATAPRSVSNSWHFLAERGGVVRAPVGISPARPDRSRPDECWRFGVGHVFTLKPDQRQRPEGPCSGSGVTLGQQTGVSMYAICSAPVIRALSLALCLGLQAVPAR
jgi:hypothetical protein